MRRRWTRALRLPHFRAPRGLARGSADVRFDAHYGLNSDIAPCPKSAKLGSQRQELQRQELKRWGGLRRWLIRLRLQARKSNLLLGFTAFLSSLDPVRTSHHQYPVDDIPVFLIPRLVSLPGLVPWLTKYSLCSAALLWLHRVHSNFSSQLNSSHSPTAGIF